MPKKYNLYLPEFSACVLVLGILKTSFYYSNFGISIKSYISISEIGLFVSTDLIILSIVIGFTLFVLKFFVVDKVINSPSSETIITEIKQEKKRWYQSRYSYWLVIISLAGFYLFTSLQTNIYPNRILFLLCFGGILYFSVLLADIDKSFKILSPNILKYSTLIFFFILNFYLITSNEIRSVENGKYTGTKIYTSDTAYFESTPTDFYIGQTEKYVFFFHKKTRHTTVIPTSEVKKVELYTHKTPM